MSFFVVFLVIGLSVMIATAAVSIVKRRLSYSLIAAFFFALSMACLGLIDVVQQVDKPACAFGFAIFLVVAALTVGCVPTQNVRNEPESPDLVQ